MHVYTYGVLHSQYIHGQLARWPDIPGYTVVFYNIGHVLIVQTLKWQLVITVVP